MPLPLVSQLCAEASQLPAVNRTGRTFRNFVSFTYPLFTPDALGNPWVSSHCGRSTSQPRAHGRASRLNASVTFRPLRSIILMPRLVSDFQFALRNLRRSPLFTLVAVGSLALG